MKKKMQSRVFFDIFVGVTPPFLSTLSKSRLYRMNKKLWQRKPCFFYFSSTTIYLFLRSDYVNVLLRGCCVRAEMMPKLLRSSSSKKKKYYFDELGGLSQIRYYYFFLGQCGYRWLGWKYERTCNFLSFMYGVASGGFIRPEIFLPTTIYLDGKTDYYLYNRIMERSLIYAVYNGHLHLCKYLLCIGMGDRKEALICATCQNHQDVVDFLRLSTTTNIKVEVRNYGLPFMEK